MTDSELLDRVAAWLASRGLTPAPGEGLWDACSGSFGATSPPALGCLLAMVREVWGPYVELVVKTSPRGHEVSVHEPDGSASFNVWLNPGEPLALALVQCLEAAP